MINTEEKARYLFGGIKLVGRPRRGIQPRLIGGIDATG